MIAAYVIAYPASASDPPGADAARADALGCVLTIGDPTGGLVTAFPSVVVTSPAIAPAVIADDSGQATLTEVDAAKAAASAAETAAAQAVTTARQTITTLLATQSAIAAQIQADAAMFAATPPGSTITAEHVAAFVRVVNGFATVQQAVVAHLVLTGNDT